MIAPRSLRRDARAVSPPTVFFGLLTLFGLVVTVVSGYLVIRGPFLGGALLPPEWLFVALLAFIVGIVTLAWGAAKAFDVGSRV